MSRSYAPIYAKSYHFHLNVFAVTKHFAKCYRPSLGQLLESTALELTIGVRSALFAKGSHGFRRQLPLVDRLKVLLQTCFDLKLIGIGRYDELIGELQEIGHMLKALCRSKRGENRSPDGRNSQSSQPYPSDASLPPGQKEFEGV